MADQSAWLIEFKPSVSRTPVYWGRTDCSEDGVLGMTPDHDAALRFTRKQDAEAVIEHYGWTEAFASEHMWCEPRAITPTN